MSCDRLDCNHVITTTEVLDQFRRTSVNRLQNLILLAYDCINNPYFASYSSEETSNDGILISSAAYLLSAQASARGGYYCSLESWKCLERSPHSSTPKSIPLVILSAKTPFVTCFSGGDDPF